MFSLLSLGKENQGEVTSPEIGQLKTNFLRLLSRYTQRVNECNGELSPENQIIFEQYFKTLKEQYETLSEEQPSFAKQYESKVVFLAKFLRKSDINISSQRMTLAERTILMARERRKAANQLNAERSQLMNVDGKHGMVKPRSSLSQIRAELFEGVDEKSVDKSGVVRRKAFKYRTRLVIAESPEIQAQQNKQEELVDDMAGLANHLKKNVMAISSLLQKDEQAIENVSALLDRQMPRVQAATESLRVHLKSASTSTLLSYCVIVGVSVIFFATYLFMKMVPSPR